MAYMFRPPWKPQLYDVYATFVGPNPPGVLVTYIPERALPPSRPAMSAYELYQATGDLPEGFGPNLQVGVAMPERIYSSPRLTSANYDVLAKYVDQFPNPTTSRLFPEIVFPLRRPAFSAYDVAQTTTFAQITITTSSLALPTSAPAAKRSAEQSYLVHNTFPPENIQPLPAQVLVSPILPTRAGFSAYQIAQQPPVKSEPAVSGTINVSLPVYVQRTADSTYMIVQGIPTPETPLLNRSLLPERALSQRVSATAFDLFLRFVVADIPPVSAQIAQPPLTQPPRSQESYKLISTFVTPSNPPVAPMQDVPSFRIRAGIEAYAARSGVPVAETFTPAPMQVQIATVRPSYARTSAYWQTQYVPAPEVPTGKGDMGTPRQPQRNAAIYEVRHVFVPPANNIGPVTAVIDTYSPTVSIKGSE